MTDSTADVAPLTPEELEQARKIAEKEAAAIAAHDGAVVNVEHLMEYVDEQKAEGNAAFRRGAAGRSEALAAWQRALDACAQCDGKPMRREDIAVVLAARSVLHSNRGQALIDGEWWHRAVKELDHAVRIDPSNAKALWRRYRCQKHLKKWAEAEADLEALQAPQLQAAAGPLLASAGLGPEELARTRAELKAKREAADAEAEETYEERYEEAAHKGIEALRERFEEVTKENGLHGNKEFAAEIAEMLTRDGDENAHARTTQHLANVYQLDEDDAAIIMEWLQKAKLMSDELHSGGNTFDDI